MNLEPNIQEFDDLWSTAYPQGDPVAEQLRHVYKDRWIRFYVLEDGKRYPDTDQERKTIIQRHRTLLAALDTKDLYYVITCEWTNSPILEWATVERQQKFYGAIHWKSVRENHEEYDTEEVHRHLFVSYHKRDDKTLEEIFEAVSKDDIAGVIIAPLDLRWIYHPYDGGADTILESREKRSELKSQFKDWAAEGV